MPQITTTPAKITPAIISLCHELAPNSQPQFLAVNPAPTANINDCFPVVDSHIRGHGGTVCYGWQIWEWPRVMIEAEFHAVWKIPSGELHEITPKQVNVSQILFLPDPQRQYEKRQVPNIRRPLSSDIRIAQFIKSCGSEFELMNRGERATQHGEIAFSEQELDELNSIHQRKNQLYDQLSSYPPRPGRNEPCNCGSGLKYKKCCGQ